jgi:hypothetical protein
MIVDFQTGASDPPAINVYGAFREKEIGGVWPIAEPPTTAEKLGKYLEDRQGILNKFDSLDDLRWISKPGDEITIVVFCKKDFEPTISITESSRPAGIWTDLESLFALLPHRVKKPDGIEMFSKSHCVRLRHGNLAISISAAKSAPPSPNPIGLSDPQAPPASEKEKPEPPVKKEAGGLSLQLKIGAPEHWFLSADIPVKGIGDIEFVKKARKKSFSPAKIRKSSTWA